MKTSRRNFLAASGTLLASRSIAADVQAPAAKGPAVWLDLDRKALDDAYDQSVWATNTRQLLERYAALSEDVRARIGAPKRFPYGPTPIEALDVYATSRTHAPIQVFI